MCARTIAASALALAGLAASTSTAQASFQPADLENVGNVDRGASAHGMHYHDVLPASGKGPFDLTSRAPRTKGTPRRVPLGPFQVTACLYTVRFSPIRCQAAFGPGRTPIDTG